MAEATLTEVSKEKVVFGRHINDQCANSFDGGRTSHCHFQNQSDFHPDRCTPIAVSLVILSISEVGSLDVDRTVIDVSKNEGATRFDGSGAEERPVVL